MEKLYDGRPREHRMESGKLIGYYSGYWTVAQCKMRCQATPECSEFMTKNSWIKRGGSGCVLLRNGTTPSGESYKSFQEFFY